jgi:rod shape-determining protein MreD
MARLIFAILVLVAIVLQGLIFPDIFAIRVLPNLVLVFVLCWSAMRGVGEGALWAFGIGIVFDALALDPMGTNSLALLAVCLLGMWAGRRFFQASIFLPIPIAFLATWVYAIIVLILRASEGGGAPLTAIGPLIFLQALLNALLVLIIYPLTRLLSRSTANAR